MTNEHSKQYIKRSAAVRVVQQYGVGVLDADEFSPEQAERFVISKLNEIPAADVIDGEAYRKLLKTAIDSVEAEIKYRGGTLDYNSGLLRATELLKVLPTVDAVAVVRCGECKHREEKTFWCEKVQDFISNPEWFCADGERKGGDEQCKQ